MPFEATFKALADATRRQILELLRAGPRSAGDIAARFGLSAATVSHHLAVLRDAGLIIDERRGKYIYYQLDTSVVEDLMAWAAGLLANRQDDAPARAGQAAQEGAKRNETEQP